MGLLLTYRPIEFSDSLPHQKVAIHSVIYIHVFSACGLADYCHFGLDLWVKVGAFESMLIG